MGDPFMTPLLAGAFNGDPLMVKVKPEISNDGIGHHLVNLRLRVNDEIRQQDSELKTFMTGRE